MRLLAVPLALLLLAPTAAAQPGPRWLTSWAQSQHTASGTELGDQSVRVVTHLSQGGESVRFRVQNQYGSAPLSVGAAAVGFATATGGVTGSVTARFRGRAAVTVPVGGEVWSDPVPLRTAAQQDLAVSLHVRGRLKPGVHAAALRENYLSPPGSGNRVTDPAPYPVTTGSTPIVSAVDVRTTRAEGVVVGYGSSVVDGHGSTSCGAACLNRRWLDDVGRRAEAELPVPFAVANGGVGGTTSAAACPGTPPAFQGQDALARLERDVLGLHGVTAVLYYYGTNDLAFGCRAPAILDSYRAAFARLRAEGIAVHVSPVTPRPGYSAQQNADRAQVNAFVREGGNCGGACDGVVDFDAVLRDPANANTIRAEFDSGDGIHANQAGQAAMARYVHLGQLRG
ncbi:lysophospholipase L1-like esterase [Crossiella equi]|uniref:Lysophospholipase L1-like esterase n=1 Tax=Crossiella equi TaxID=130796 RepID=A0ABS5AP79_9PSEU|nr:GDSL-type esterase/lipase family protein [Crossiella equi]MBP2478388.1 lysophospholipase L1-like esterase [Crossiella equi]